MMASLSKDLPITSGAASSSLSFGEYFNQLGTNGNWSWHLDTAYSSFRALPTPSMFAKQHLLYSESVIINLDTPAGFYMQRKDYSSYQIQYTVLGHGKLLYDLKEYDLLPGDCYFINCQEAHKFFTVGNDDWIHHGIQFNGCQLDILFKEFYKNSSVKVSLGISDEISTLFLDIANTSSSKLATADLIMNQLLWTLITKIMLCDQATSEIQLTAHIADACQFIEKHFAQINSISDIASACYISKFYLCREFKRQTGRTVIEYLTLVRINAAKQLLISTNLPIIEIANQTGFHSSDYFHSVFRQSVGITPLKYRKQTRSH